MEKIKMWDGSLEKFIVEFLPEGTLLYDKNPELIAASFLINIFFYRENDTSVIEQTFDAFTRLGYPISVVEPLLETRKYRPYMDTNSNSIYIAINPEKFNDLTGLLQLWKESEPVIPCELKEMYNLLHQFIKDNTTN